MISGIIISNLTVSATAATYINDLDANMFAVFMAVMAAYLWKRYRFGFCFGILCVAIQLGIYQCLLSVTLTLIAFQCILSLIRHERFSKVFMHGIKAIVMVGIGSCVYLVCTRLICKFTGVSLVSGSYNSLDEVLKISPMEMFRRAIEVYPDTWKHLFHSNTALPDGVAFFSTVITILPVASMGVYLFDKEIHLKEKALGFILLVFLPLCMDFTYILMGRTHDLMTYAIWFVYLLAILMADRTDDDEQSTCVLQRGHGNTAKGIMRGVLLVSVLILLIGNVRTANTLYLKKDIEKQANISYYTRVIDMVEHQTEYKEGETPIVFVGKPLQLSPQIQGFEKYSKITGAWSTFIPNLANRGCIQAYFDYVLLSTIKLADYSIWEAMQSDERVDQMPSYPDAECIQMIDGVMVVKLSDKK